MNHRPFGRIGVPVSEVGYGGWGIGGEWGQRDDRLAVRSLNLALDLGVDFFDTAHDYGDGHGEKLIGGVLRDRGARSKVFLATKVPPKDQCWPARYGSDVRAIFPGTWIRKITEMSLKNLGTDFVDLQQLHVWAPNWLNQGDWLDVLEDLKREGKIRNVGISLNDHEPDSALEAVRSGIFDSVQVIYNLFDQAPAERLFPLCRKNRVSVIVRVPFDEGGLTGALSPGMSFPEDDWRCSYFEGDRLRETYERAERLKVFLGDEAKALPELALRFCLSDPAVTTVIPGMRRPEHVRTNCAVSDGKRLSQETILKLKEHAWPRNFYL
jgi:aryl-alcohol dehydrogenase-like predicted oxidoreductase